MDPQQIREALHTYSRMGVVTWPSLTMIREAASEYADLLEASERVWWCESDRTGMLGPTVVCTAPVNVTWHDNCGWRLLTPERTD